LFLAGICAVTADEPAGSPPAALVRLKDKSQIAGRIVGLKDGVYEVRTESLGVVNVPESKVASITYERAAAPVVAGGPETPAATAATPEDADPFDIDLDLFRAGLATTGLDFEALLKSMAANPALMVKVEALRKDASLQAVMNDPAIMKAVQSGDLAALLNNEKIKALLENPNVQAVTQDVLDGQAPKPTAAAKIEPAVPAAAKE
jgi:hypothetical protein